jgi:GT2 family glycosyltransferase
MRLPTVSIVSAVNRYMPQSWLQALASQVDVEYDVFIVDARLDDDYGPLIERSVTDPEQRARLHYTRIERGGRASANNVGIDQSGGEVVVFLGDDQLPEPRTARAHARFHAQHPEPFAVGIGPSVFAVEDRTPFAQWLDRTGQIYGVETGGETRAVPENFFYVANASVKRSFLDAVGRFDERFPEHCWDDYELGLRLHDAGMVARLVRDAMTTHHHHVTLRERSATMVESGSGARIFESLRPGPHPWAPVVARRPWVHRLRASLHLARYAVRRDELALDRFYRRILDAGFSDGYRRVRLE